MVKAALLLLPRRYLRLRLWLAAPILPILAADRIGQHIFGSIYRLLSFFIGSGGSIGSP